MNRPKSLTDLAVRNAKPLDKQYKITDGDGMFLLVQPSGGKYWRLAYRYLGKQKTLALGVYPEVSLASARQRRAEAREKLAVGFDPGELKKSDKHTARLAAENSFEVVANAWIKEHGSTVTPKQCEKTL
ncbi:MULTISPECIES: Arm DNA-binding domain-containing protein [Cupriavidus]